MACGDTLGNIVGNIAANGLQLRGWVKRRQKYVYLSENKEVQ
jgi:hypothetical protein